MFVKRYGTGEKVFLGLHGWGGDHTTFAPLAERLPDGVTLHCPDLPGYGRSAEPREWCLDAVMDEVMEVVAEVADGGARKVTLVGNCSGAILGLLAAQQADDFFERLVLIDPFAYVPWYFDLFVSTDFGRYAYYSTFANPVGRRLTNLSLKRRRGRHTDLTASFTRVNHRATYRYLRMLAAVGSYEQFGDLRMPIDLLYGERTFRAVKRSAAMYKALLPQVRLVELAGAGHLPIVEATAPLCDMIFEKAERVTQPLNSI